VLEVAGKTIRLISFDAAWEAFVQVEMKGSMHMSGEAVWRNPVARRFEALWLLDFTKGEARPGNVSKHCGRLNVAELPTSKDR